MSYILIAIIGILAGIPIGYIYHKSVSLSFLDRLDYHELHIRQFFNKFKDDVVTAAIKDESKIAKNIDSVISDSDSINPINSKTNT